jgi:replication factor C subunit 3/5
MFLFDKYQPLTLKQLDFHKSLSDKLIKVARTKEMPNLLFYGPESSGKQTRILALLYEIYGEDIYDVSKSVMDIKVPGSSQILNINILESPHHIMIDPTQKSNYDRYIIQYIIDNYVKKPTFESYMNEDISFKTIVILNANMLSNGAQSALRYTLEKYMKSCRFILKVNQITNIIDPVISRFLLIRVPKPPKESVVKTVNRILDLEGLIIPEKNKQVIFDNFSYDLKKVLLAIEGNQNNISWISLIENIINNIVKSKPKLDFYNDVREIMNKILINNIPDITIFRVFLKKILEKIVSNEDKIAVIQIISKYQFLETSGKNDILYFETMISDIVDYLHN